MYKSDTMKTITIIAVAITICLVLWIFISGSCRLSCTSSSELYTQGDYYQMSHLPWATPPTGIGALGESELKDVRAIYPGQRFFIGDTPVSCPSKECPNMGVRIYETGNALNPNVQSYIGFIHSDEIA